METESKVVGQLENKPDKNESETQQISKKAGKPKSSKRVAKIKSKDNSEVRVSSGLKNKKLTKIGDVQNIGEIRPVEKEAEKEKESKLKPKKEKVAKIISLIEKSKKPTKIEELKPRESLTLENKKTITPKMSRENQTNAGKPLQPTNSPRKTQTKKMQTLKTINQESEITLQNVSKKQHELASVDPFPVQPTPFQVQPTQDHIPPDDHNQYEFVPVVRLRVHRRPQSLFHMNVPVQVKEIQINRDMTKDTSITKVRGKPVQSKAKPPPKEFASTEPLEGITKDVLEDQKEFTLERWVLEQNHQTIPEKCKYDAEISHVGSKQNKVEISVGNKANQLQPIIYSFGDPYFVKKNQFFKILNLENRKIRIEIKYLKKRS